MKREVTFAGFGGQGIMTAGKFLALAGMAEGLEVCWIPSYGPEMRGGTAYCTVVISDRPIGSPVVNEPEFAVVMNRPSLDKFAPKVQAGGLVVINSSLIDVTSDREDIAQLQVACNQIAHDLKNARSANMVVLGAFVARSDMVKVDTVRDILKQKFGRKPAVLESVMQVFEAGVEVGLAGKEADA